METTSNPTTGPLPDQMLPPANWKERVAKAWWGLKVADQAAQVDAGLRRQRIVEHSVRQAHDAAFSGGTRQTPWPAELEEEMGVRVGDELHYHMPPQLPASSTPAAAGSTLGTLGKMAAGAALLAGGAYGPAALTAALKLLTPAAAVSQADVAPAEPAVLAPPIVAPAPVAPNFNADFGLSFPDAE